MKSATRLRQFRRQCEQEAGKSADQITVPLLFVLNDICRVLKLPKPQQRKVLGRHGFVRLSHDREWHASLADDKPETI